LTSSSFGAEFLEQSNLVFLFDLKHSQVVPEEVAEADHECDVGHEEWNDQHTDENPNSVPQPTGSQGIVPY